MRHSRFVWLIVCVAVMLSGVHAAGQTQPEGQLTHRSLIFEVHFQELEVYFVKNKGLPMLFLAQCGQMTI